MAKKKTKKRRRRSMDLDEERDYGSDPDIPTVLDADEIIDKAFRRASKVMVPDHKPFFSARKTAEAKLSSVAGTIDATLSRYIATFPDFNVLHPFHRDLYGTIFELDKAQRSLASLRWCKAQVATIARKNASQIHRSKSRDFISKKVKEAYGRINSVVQEVKRDLKALALVREKLQKVPRIEVDCQTAVVAGAPNVGKSQLVRQLSTGKPEVAPYPFTTKAVSVGHFEYRRIKFQVLDTPGILDRPWAKRNKIEHQAIMALRHLAHATIFMFDPTEECGTDMEGQSNLLKEILEKFVGEDPKLFIVLNKSDIKDRWKEVILNDVEEVFEVSSMVGDGVEELKEAVSKFLRKRVMDSGRLF